MAQPEVLMSGLSAAISDVNNNLAANDLSQTDLRARMEQITAAVSGLPDTTSVIATQSVVVPLHSKSAELLAYHASLWRRKGYFTA